MKTIVEFPANTPTIAILNFFDTIRTIDHTFLQTDNLHHKFAVESRYPNDFVAIGEFVYQCRKTGNVTESRMTDEQVFAMYVAGALSGSDAVTVQDAIRTADELLKLHRERFPFVSPRIGYVRKCPECDGKSECKVCDSTGMLKP